MEEKKVIIFEGGAYTGSGKEIPLSGSVSTNQVGAEIVFTHLLGRPSATPLIEIIHSSGVKREIDINEEGVIAR